MTVLFDATANATGANVASLSWTHTTGAGGADRAVAVGFGEGGTQAITNVQYAGTNLTEIGRLVAGALRTSLWRLLNQATGAQTVTINLGGGADIAAGSVSMTGVDQTTPTGTYASASGVSTAATVTVVSAVDDLVLDTVVHANAVLTVGGGQTVRWDVVPFDASTSAGSTEPGAASVVMSWALDIAVEWVTGGVSFKAAAPAVAAPEFIAPVVETQQAWWNQSRRTAMVPVAV